MGVLTRHHSSYNDGEATLVEGEGFSFECEVAAAPLRTILRPEEVARARVVKIDVEGAEGAVVDGMAELLERCRPDLELVVEIHPKQLERTGKTPAEVLSVFAAAGFSPYRIEDDGWSHSYMGRIPRQAPVPIEGEVSDETIVVLSRTDPAT